MRAIRGYSTGPVRLGLRGRLAVALAQLRGLPPPAPSIVRLRRALVEIAALRERYSFGGGHAPRPGPSEGDLGIGLDCSGAIRWALVKAGLLPALPNVNTAALLEWGEHGEGLYITVWVRQTPSVQHAVIETKHLGLPRFWEAGHTGMLVGFIGAFDTTGYTPRRRP